MDNKDKAQKTLDRWGSYQQYQEATGRVLRTVNIAEALAIIFLFFLPPVAQYGFIPMAGILWIVVLFGGERFWQEVEEQFPEDAAMREYVRDADARTTNPLRWGEFFTNHSGREFAWAVLQAAAIVVLLFLR